jgi:MarR family transcriptional regulator, organic hydroperoxide resistance regulator
VEETVSVECSAAQRNLQQYDLNWLINRAAHELREAMDAEALANGITIRGQIVLTALVQHEMRKQGRPYSQLALSAALGLDKTTMTAVLDKLEAQGLLVRTPDPGDRRARIPVSTESGRALQAKLYHELQCVEARVLSDLDEGERDQLRGLLRRIISPEHVDGSCM